METSYEKFMRVCGNLARIWLIILIPAAIFLKNWGLLAAVCLVTGLQLLESNFKIWKKPKK